MTDEFDNHGYSLDSPLANGASVTPSDSSDLATVSRCLFVGTGGNLVVVLNNGDEVTLNNVADGSYHPLRVKRVKATSTTATNIVALY